MSPNLARFRRGFWRWKFSAKLRRKSDLLGRVRHSEVLEYADETRKVPASVRRSNTC